MGSIDCSQAEGVEECSQAGSAPSIWNRICITPCSLLQMQRNGRETIVRSEDSIARGARVRARLQWIDEGDVGSKFYFVSEALEFYGL